MLRSRFARLVALLLVWALLPVPPALAQSGTVEDVLVTGLNRMTREAFLHAFGVRPGEPFDRRQVLRGYRNLWDLGLFEDLVIETETGAQGGTVLVVKVVERPVLSSVDFEENKVLTRTAIEDRLKERKAPLDLGKPLNLKNVAAAEQVIRDMLGEKGYLAAEVSHRIDEITRTSRGVRFAIRPGGKTRIGSIEFTGNALFSDRRLRRELKLNEPRRWWWPWSNKSLYHPLKWDQDANKIRELYQNEGYLDVVVRPPVVEVEKETRKGEAEPPPPPPPASPAPPGPAPSTAESQAREEAAAAGVRQGTRAERKAERAAEKARKKAEKAERKKAPRIKRVVALTVPIVEGQQYRLGTIKAQGNTVFPEATLVGAVPLKSGDVLREGVLKGAVEGIARSYNDRGYLYATAVRQIQRRPGEPVADVTIDITEDQPYYVNRIQFSGNTNTQDRVLRREMVLTEGELFSKSKLDLSKYKINQLGYFEVKDEPVIQPVEGENRVDVVMAGEEKGRNEIQVGGGYSGVDGGFFTGYYSTRNFLGRGQILSTSIQLGGRASRYSIQFIEPWFMNRPYTAGFSLYRRDVDYGGNLRSSGKGGGLVLGRQVSRFGRVSLNYNYETVTSTGFTLTGAEATNRISSITPQYQINKLDDFYRPRRGWLTAVDAQLAGGALGGDTSFYKPILTFTRYQKAWGRSLFGWHAEGGQIRAWGSGSSANTANVFGVPRVQRFWLGGDTQGPRVFESRSITPLRFVRLDGSGQIVEATDDPRGRLASDFDRNGDRILDRRDLVEMGGDRYFLLQGEYVFPLRGPAELAAFLDVGNTLFEDQSWGFDDVRASAGIEMRFYLPVFPVPLRLIFGVPLRDLPEDRHSSFTFSIGKSF